MPVLSILNLAPGVRTQIGSTILSGIAPDGHETIDPFLELIVEELNQIHEQGIYVSVLGLRVRFTTDRCAISLVGRLCYWYSSVMERVHQ